MSENTKAAPSAYIGTREITSSPKFMTLCVLVSLLVVFSLLNIYFLNAGRAQDVISVYQSELEQAQKNYDKAKNDYENGPPGVPTFKQKFEAAERELNELKESGAPGSLFDETLLAAFNGDNAAASSVSCLLIVLFACMAVFAWLAYAGKWVGLTGLRFICLIVCGISILYTVVAALLFAYTLIDNCIKGWEVFALRRSFTIFTLLASLAQSMFMIKACRVLGLMQKNGRVANEAPLRLNAGLAAAAGAVIVLGYLGLTLPFGSTVETYILRIDFADQLQVISLPAWYTGFTYYQGGFWELMKVIFTWAVIICGGMCI